MSNALRHNRKGTDEQIVRLNCLGVSQSAIGLKLDCHQTSVAARLKQLKIPPVDTRRGFMEDVLHGVPDETVDALAERLMSPPKPTSIKEFVRSLILQEMERSKSDEAPIPQEA